MSTIALPVSPSREEVNVALRTFAASQRETDWAIGEWLIAADELNVHVEFACSNFCEYVGRIFGWHWRQALQRLDTARRLRELPGLCERLRDGRLTWSAVREVARIATPETEVEWLEKIDGKSLREIEPIISGHEPGDRPTTPKDPRKKVRKVVLTFTQEEYERFVAGIGMQKKDCDDFLSWESATLVALEEKAAERAGDGSRSRNQLLFVKSLDTQTTYIAGEAGLVEITEEAAEVLECDSVQIGLPSQAVAGGKAKQTVPPSVRRMCFARAGKRCQVPGCRQKHNLDLHHLKLRKDGGTHDPENLVLLCACHHRAFHDGWLMIDGSWGKGFLFRHVNGKLYGTADSLTLLRDANEALQILRSWGFFEHTARAALDLLRVELESGFLTLEDLLDAAFSLAGPATAYRFGPGGGPIEVPADVMAAAHVGRTEGVDART